MQGHASTEGFSGSRPKSVEPLSTAFGIIFFPEFDKNWVTFFPDLLYEYHPLVSFFSNSLRIRPHDPENVFSWSSMHWRSWRMPILLKTRISEHSSAGNSTGYIEKHFTFADLLTKFSPIIWIVFSHYSKYFFQQFQWNLFPIDSLTLKGDFFIWLYIDVSHWPILTHENQLKSYRLLLLFPFFIWAWLLMKYFS